LEEGIGLLSLWLKATFGLVGVEDFLKSASKDEATEKIFQAVEKIYSDKEASITPVEMRHLERMVSLQVIDSRWKDHLYAMDILREGIHLRAYGQRDPLIEYQHEGFAMFGEMMSRIDEDIVNLIFKVQTLEGKRIRGVFLSVPQSISAPELSTDFASRMPQKEIPDAGQVLPESNLPAREKPQPFRTPPGTKVGRNDPCPCGSGKKYKKCCGK
jgi:preprotein translocase subunit SecA